MSIYCTADFHGCYWAWAKIRDMLKPDDKLYFLGDAADRGENGWQIIKELLRDKRVIYIKGNHEKFLVDAIHSAGLDNFYYNNAMRIWFYNGGESTYNNIMSDTFAPTEKKKILKQLDNLIFCAVYYNKQGQCILLSHAGCDNIRSANRYCEEDFLWNREHLEFYDNWSGEDDEVIVHGHTPIDLLYNMQCENAVKNSRTLPEYNGGAYWYAQGHKVDIDMGTVWDNKVLLLNLDTWEDIVIKNEEY